MNERRRVVVILNPASAAGATQKRFERVRHDFERQLDVVGVRPWRDGDQRRDVHWAATARVGDVIVAEGENSAVELYAPRDGVVVWINAALENAPRWLVTMRLCADKPDR